MTLVAFAILSALCPQECLTGIAMGASLAIFEILFPQPTESTT